jgi:energy-coupling factor transporter ATP-binding protein EcfA2
MTIALEVRALSKRYRAGSGACLASTDVLRGVNLCVHAGEAVSIIGGPGSGKSTLLLCLAGLLAPDLGEVRWFGETCRALAMRRVIYHITRTDLLRAGRIEEPNLHLVDVHDADPLALESWVHARRRSGDAVIVAHRRDAGIEPRGRVLRLSRGILSESSDPWPRVRVAEPSC